MSKSVLIKRRRNKITKSASPHHPILDIIHISEDRKVGIGIKDPVSFLDVAGSIRINGGSEISMVQGETNYLPPSWHDQRMTATIHFPKAFQLQPKVLVNALISKSRGVLISQVTSIDTSSFEISLYMMLEEPGSHIFHNPIQVDWLAWTTTSQPTGTCYLVGYPFGDFDFSGIGGQLI